MNWFYPHEKSTIATKDTLSFQHIYEISEILDLKVKKINSIDFINNKIIAKLENGKIGIF